MAEIACHLFRELLLMERTLPGDAIDLFLGKTLQSKSQQEHGDGWKIRRQGQYSGFQRTDCNIPAQRPWASNPVSM